jgi:flavin-binding protein dodecin
MKSTEDITGYSEIGIDEAIQNALNKIKNLDQFEVVETLGEKGVHSERQYQVTLKARQK